MEAQTGLPDTSSPEAEEGTALHAIAAWCLQNGHDAVEHVDRVFHYDDHGVAKTFWMDEEGAECVQTFLDVVREQLAACVEAELLVEQRFHLEHLHPEFFGTADAVIVNKRTGYPIAVYDLKCGKGVIVEVRKEGKINKQTGYYGLGAIGNKPIHTGIGLCIVQPRAYHPDGPVRRTYATAEELEELARELVWAAKWTEEKDAARKAGEWCRFCKASPTCGELREHVYHRANLVWNSEDDAPMRPAGVPELMRDPPSPDAVAHWLAAADVIEQWIKDVRQYAHSMAERGHDVPGWKLVQKRATRKWIDATAAAESLLWDYGLDKSSCYRQVILSPAQAEKLVPKAQRQEMSRLWTKESSGVTLVREDNHRPTVLPSSTSAFIEDQREEKE